MTDANTICHDVDLLGDWLDSRGYTEEAGLCLRVLGLIHEQAEENEKLRAAMHDIYEVYAGSEGFIPETCPEAYLQERVKEMAYIAAKHKRTVALKE